MCCGRWGICKLLTGAKMPTSLAANASGAVSYPLLSVWLLIPFDDMTTLVVLLYVN